MEGQELVNREIELLVLLEEEVKRVQDAAKADKTIKPDFTLKEFGDLATYFQQWNNGSESPLASRAQVVLRFLDPYRAGLQD